MVITKRIEGTVNLVFIEENNIVIDVVTIAYML